MLRAVEESKFRVNKTDIRPRRLDIQRNVDVVCNSRQIQIKTNQIYFLNTAAQVLDWSSLQWWVYS